MIYEHYTIFNRIPLVRTPDGAYYADELWHPDLVRHLTYIDDLHLCCPVEYKADVPDKHILAEGFTDENVIAMRRDFGPSSILRNIIPNFFTVRRAVRATEVVHSGGAGWAFPDSYYILLLHWFYRFKWMFLMESAFWVVDKGEKASLRKRIVHAFHAFILRSCTRAADARVMTTKGYKAYFRAPDKNTQLATVTWISDEMIILDEDHEAEWSKRSGPIRIVSAARMIPEKGTPTILDAVRLFDRDVTEASDPPELQLDMIGSGELEGAVRDLAKSHKGRIKVRFLDPVPYGDPFFELIRTYDGLLVANRKAEQVRVVFDAFGQGIPMISTATEGMAGVIEDGKTGFLYGIDSAEELAGVFGKLIGNRAKLQEMGRNAQSKARQSTHAHMHAEREAFLIDALNLRRSA